MKKTAITQLIELLEEQKESIPVEAYQKGLEYAIQAAETKLETERKQIEEAHYEGGYWARGTSWEAAEYYKETYG